MMYIFRCLVKCGHVGSGKYYERMVYVRARNTTDALNKVKHYRGVKKGNLLRSGASVLTIEKEM